MVSKFCFGDMWRGYVAVGDRSTLHVAISVKRRHVFLGVLSRRPRGLPSGTRARPKPKPSNDFDHRNHAWQMVMRAKYAVA